MREIHCIGHAENSEMHPDANRDGRQNHERKIRSRTAQRHPGRAARVALLPGWIVGRARPADHPVRDKIREDRYDHQSKGLASDVRPRVERYLAAVKSRGIAADSRNQRVRAFVAGGRKQENDVPDNAEDQELGSHAARQTKASGHIAQGLPRWSAPAANFNATLNPAKSPANFTNILDSPSREV
jgi:hypothetical protein